MRRRLDSRPPGAWHGLHAWSITGATSFAYDGTDGGHAAGRSLGHDVPLLDEEDDESPPVQATIATIAAIETPAAIANAARRLKGP